MTRRVVHSVRTEQNPVTGRWTAACTCGATCPRPSTHKPVVDTWRKNHYAEVNQ